MSDEAVLDNLAADHRVTLRDQGMAAPDDAELIPLCVDLQQCDARRPV